MSSNKIDHNDENKTFFVTKFKQFPPIIDENIKTQDFIAAINDLIQLTEKLGLVFAAIISDMKENVQKIDEKFKSDSEKNQFIEDMILYEQDENESTTLTAMLWLTRELEFIMRFLQLIIEDTESDVREANLIEVIKMAYSETLDNYHGWVGNHLFRIMVRFSPSRSQFFKSISVNKKAQESEVIKEMKLFTRSLEICVDHLTEFFYFNELDDTLYF